MSLECRDCRDGWEHCHGTVIIHLLRRTECTEDGCNGTDHIPHAFRIDCEAVGCRCAEPDALAV